MLRAFLAVSALLWLPYGVFCFVMPEALAGIAGVTTASKTGAIEIRAMYGGLQMALGAFAGAALLRPELQRPAVLAIAFLTGGLFIARLLGAALAAEVSGYTAGGLLFEIVCCAFATRLAASSAPAAVPA